MQKIYYEAKIEDLEDLLDCPDKLTPSEEYLLTQELIRIKSRLPHHQFKTNKIKAPISSSRRCYILRDKAKHGCYHWASSKRKKHLIKKANGVIRHSHLFSNHGENFKKCFDVSWELY